MHVWAYTKIREILSGLQNKTAGTQRGSESCSWHCHEGLCRVLLALSLSWPSVAMQWFILQIRVLGKWKVVLLGVEWEFCFCWGSGKLWEHVTPILTTGKCWTVYKIHLSFPEPIRGLRSPEIRKLNLKEIKYFTKSFEVDTGFQISYLQIP